MLTDKNQKITDAAKQVISEALAKFQAGLLDVNSERELYESMYREFRKKLMKGRMATKKEKELLLTVLRELEKVIQS